jgi:hypothetical protein
MQDHKFKTSRISRMMQLKHPPCNVTRASSLAVAVAAAASNASQSPTATHCKKTATWKQRPIASPCVHNQILDGGDKPMHACRCKNYKQCSTVVIVFLNTSSAPITSCAGVKPEQHEALSPPVVEVGYKHLRQPSKRLLAARAASAWNQPCSSTSNKLRHACIAQSILVLLTRPVNLRELRTAERQQRRNDFQSHASCPHKQEHLPPKHRPNSEMYSTRHYPTLYCTKSMVAVCNLKVLRAWRTMTHVWLCRHVCGHPQPLAKPTVAP